MNRPIIPARLPEQVGVAPGPQPYSPQWLNGLSDGQRQVPEHKEFLRRVHESGDAHVTWMLWQYQSKVLSSPTLVEHASVFFLDCGRGPFAVTAGHVFNAYLDHRQKYRVISAQIANSEFDPAERLISCGSEMGIDIATFRVTPAEIAATGKTIVRGSDGSWPNPPKKDEVVYFGGFPSCERDRITRNEFAFGIHSATVPVTSFTAYQLCCQLDRIFWIDVRGLGLPPVGYQLSGMSGGPMLQPFLKDGEWDWRLVGVISQGVMMQDFERITAVRAHFIQPNGRLSLW